ncbi:Yip1 domain-containing protein [Mrakia frigida]|uniref:Yip1 domain-containing protein n=1 Tax=Mrakia frigida TaxID=29902 RepID=UPI003FCC0761
MNTLDEPVSETILRDLKSIYAKLLQVLYPPRAGSSGSGGSELLKEWDLWGPLVICLALAIVLSLDAPADQSIQAFSMVISLVALGSVVVTVNAQLLGGKVSFFQSLCVLGYCVAPLLLASIISYFLHSIWIRLPVSLGSVAWAVWASVNFMSGTRLPSSRQSLAVYPLFLFYFILAWMILIQ